MADDPVESFAVDEGAEAASGLVDGPRSAGANRAEAMNSMVQGFEARGKTAFKADREVLGKAGASGLIAGESQKHPLHTAEEIAGTNVEDIHRTRRIHRRSRGSRGGDTLFCVGSTRSVWPAVTV